MMILKTKNIVWLLIIFDNSISIMANKINIKDSDNDMLEAMADIIRSCQINDHSSILIAGNFDHDDIQLLSDIKPKIIKSSLELPKQSIENTIESLIISTDSADNLTQFLMQMTHSVIGDRLKYNIFLNKSTLNNNCSEYFSYLYIALQHDMINTIFLCTTSSKQIILYTCNPYVNWAPAPWKINKHQWKHTQLGYIYTTQYKPSQDVVTCGDLFFDKTHRLDGYSGVRAVTYVPLKFSYRKMFYNYELSPKKVFDYEITKCLFMYLGIPLSYTVSHDYGTFDKVGNSCGVDKYVADNEFDILIDSRFLSYTNDTVQSSLTLGETGVTFISHYRPNVSTIMRIINYFKPIIMFFSIIVLGITIVILKISINGNFSTAVMEVLRIFFNGPLLRVPNRHSPRIYLFTILIFILVMQSILRSKILSFIMAPESNNLETFEDLANHKEYTVYCKKGFDYLLPPEIKKRCQQKTLFATFANQTKGVLVWDEFSNIGMTYQYKMHQSKEIIAKHHIIFRMRKNWPLAKRANKIFGRILESGMNRYYFEYANRYVELKNPDLISNEINNSRTLNLQDLNFAFQTLVFGLILACIMFFIEIKCWDYIHQYFHQILPVLTCKTNYHYPNKC